MEIIDFVQNILGFGIIGGCISGIIELLKSKDFSPLKTKFFTLGISIVAGSIFAWLYKSSYSESILLVLGSASAFYAFFLNKQKNG